MFYVTFYSVFPSKMTAFGIKQHGEDGLAEGNPFGLYTLLRSSERIAYADSPLGRIGHPRDMAGVGEYNPSLRFLPLLIHTAL